MIGCTVFLNLYGTLGTVSNKLVKGISLITYIPTVNVAETFDKNDHASHFGRVKIPGIIQTTCAKTKNTISEYTYVEWSILIIDYKK